MENIGNDKWISIDGAAEYLGVKIGKQWKFKCSELDNWVSSGKSAMG